MTQINNFELNIAIKIATNKCLAEDVKEFLALDTSHTEVDPKTEKRLIRKLNFDEWKNVRRFSAKALKYASITLVSLVSLFFALSMMIQPVRAAFFGAIVTWYEDYIVVRYVEDADENKNVDDGMIPAKMNYIPDGWSVVSENLNNGKYLCRITDLSEGYICLTQSEDHESGTRIDNKVIEEEIVFLKNDTIEAKLFVYENNKYVLLWKDTYMFMLEGRSIELNELLKIAEGIE